jgi:hypothetical protein
VPRVPPNPHHPSHVLFFLSPLSLIPSFTLPLPLSVLTSPPCDDPFCLSPFLHHPPPPSGEHRARGYMGFLFFLLDARSCESLCVDEISLFWASSWRPLPRTASQLTSMSAHLSVAALPLWSAVAGPSLAASQSPLLVQLQCKNHHPWWPIS